MFEFIVRPVAAFTPPWTYPSPVVSACIPGLKGNRKGVLCDCSQAAHHRFHHHHIRQSHRCLYEWIFNERGVVRSRYPSFRVSIMCVLAVSPCLVDIQLYAVLLFLQHASECEPRHGVLHIDSRVAPQSVANVDIGRSFAPIVIDILRLLRTLGE